MDKDRVFNRELSPHLADRFQKRHALDIANGPSHLDQTNVRLPGSGNLLAGSSPYAALDLISDMRDDLDRLTKVVTSPLFFNDTPVNLSRGDVVQG